MRDTLKDLEVDVRILHTFLCNVTFLRQPVLQLGRGWRGGWEFCETC